MGWRAWNMAALVGVVLLLPTLARAQEATVSGVVTDTTGGVLPGVTITAVHEDSGNTFVAVTDQQGAFRLPVRTGAYRLAVELAGFASLNRRLDLLLGQVAVINLQMAPAALAENVTVTGEAPLVNPSTSTLAGNIDPKQMQELPLNGRNWMDLAMLAPGSRQNQSSGAPLLRQGYSQINIDGQQVTNNYIGLGDDQPRFSRDSIAEFVVITNRFDATQGRSAGMIANAVTKSGTNVFSGGVSGYFRDDSLNAADKVQNVVLPYSNQQFSTTAGGPIRKDRVHFFVNYEFEREPQVLVFSATGALAAFNQNVPAPRNQNIVGGRVDTQFSPKVRLAIRANAYAQRYYTGGGATNHPSTAQVQWRHTRQYYSDLTTVLGNSAVNELKGGYSTFKLDRHGITQWAGGNFPNADTYSFWTGAPVRVSFRGYSVGTVVQHHHQNLISARDDLTFSYTAGGRHDVKTGAEYIYNLANLIGCASLCTPRIIAQNGAPTSINLLAAFPVWDDASTWNYNLIAPLAQRWEQSFAKPDAGAFFRDIIQHNVGGWLQDDWKMSSHLTVNLGVRWDIQTGIGAGLNLPPFLPGPHPNDLNNFAPRLGFAYTVNDRTVLRGGYGRFYAQGTADENQQTVLYVVGASPLVNYDGRPTWPTNPFNGPAPTYDQVIANACDLNGFRAGCQVRQFIPEINSPFWAMPFSNQASIGIQRQISSVSSFETDFVYTGGRGEEYSKNINLTYNPVTGANYPSSDATKRAIPQFGPIQMSLYEGRSSFYGWENSFTKRMSQHWQLSATYTLSQFKDSDPAPWLWSVADGHLVRSRLGFKVAPDLGEEYTLAATDQRHRAVLNGIWDVGAGVQMSGVYFYGSGERRGTSYGGDQRDEAAGGTGRLRPDGTIVARNNLVGQPIHRVDVRLQKRIRFSARSGIDGMLEVFNLFNHANYGSYTTQESSSSYGRPAFNSNISYQPRVMQLGFRFTF